MLLILFYFLFDRDSVCFFLYEERKIKCKGLGDNLNLFFCLKMNSK